LLSYENTSLSEKSSSLCAIEKRQIDGYIGDFRNYKDDELSSDED